MTMQNILKEYKKYYKGQENYYHNFTHASWVVQHGLLILDTLNPPLFIRDSYIHATACHDAGHLNGLQKNDRENVDIALSIFKKHNTHQDQISKEISTLIIDSTCVPYVSIEKLQNTYFFDTNPTNWQLIWEAVRITRDVDHLGIIGIQHEKEREKALTGFMRELLRKQSFNEILKTYEESTNIFFDKLSTSFYTDYGKKWANKNLEKMRIWQLEFTPIAINNILTEKSI